VYIFLDSALSSCQIQSEGWGGVEGLGMVKLWGNLGKVCLPEKLH